METFYRNRADKEDRAGFGRVYFLAGAVLAIDYLTGKNVHFPIFYLLPVGLAAWRGKKTLGYLLAVLLPVVRIAFHFLWQDKESLPIDGLNAFIEIGALLLYAYLIDRTASQTRGLQKRVKTLEGILPICSSCKKIRNEKNEYEPIEQYISERSEASFSHGLCSDCAKKLYPEYFTEKEKN